MFRLEKFYARDFNAQQYWDSKYSQEHIAGKSSDEFRKQGFWPLLNKHLVKGKRYLDAGCGIGGWIIFLKDQGYTVEGIDTAARTVRALSEYDPDLVVKVAPITGIPYADSSLDGVLAIGTLEYVENKIPEALREVSRVLAPGGVFLMEVPIANVLRRVFYIPLKLVEGMIRRARGEHPTFANYLFQRGELKDLLRAAGFDIVEEQAHELPEAESHYGLYIDWPFLRGDKPYHLNLLGRIVRGVCDAFSPWVASTGTFIVARKTGTHA